MEGKSPAALSAMMIGVLLMVLFMAQNTSVEAKPIHWNCETPLARLCFYHCTKDPGTIYCGFRCGCTPEGGEPNIDEMIDGTSDFCKLGCVSSMCSKIIALHKSAGRVSELTEVAAERCNNTCFQFCSKKSGTVVVAAK
ncbi:hypothetical protein C5167_029979 [Papaver somniferum]|uniref:thionin-like n=1 Tax=Papaver somniferum TaxID=3469 RepID=UPI000E6F9559|nr:thionin-like [Papaver somniferum]RZC86629.1 hypothetical protein C5167_029979 [Papaver somniferum]